MAELRGGSTAGGSPIVTKADVPVIFRVNGGLLQYSADNGITWDNADYTTDGTAAAAQILSGYTAYVNGTKITGTIPSKGVATITPSTVNQTIAAGQYLSGIQTILGDADLVAANIKSGINIFGVAGTYSGYRYATGTTTATTVAATLGWQPRVVAVREVQTGGVYGGFWLAFGPTFERHTQVIVSGDGVYVPYVYDYPATTYNFIYMTSAGGSAPTTYAAITTTGFSIATASYGNAGASFVWYAWE